MALDDMAVFARTNRLVDALQKEIRQAGIATQRLSNDDAAPAGPGVRFTTMHRAKGLEFKVVFVADCSSEELPLRSNLDRLADPRIAKTLSPVNAGCST